MTAQLAHSGKTTTTPPRLQAMVGWGAHPRRGGECEPLTAQSTAQSAAQSGNYTADHSPLALQFHSLHFRSRRPVSSTPPGVHTVDTMDTPHVGSTV